MAVRGRPAGGSKSPGVRTKTPASGRKKGTIDRFEMTDIMREHIWETYLALGDKQALLRWAEANFSTFLRECLARIMPAFPSPEPVVQITNQVTVNRENLSDWDVARRLAFALNQASIAIDGTCVITSQPEPVKPEAAPVPKPSPVTPTAETSLPPDIDVEQFGSAAEQGIKRRNLI